MLPRDLAENAVLRWEKAVHMIPISFMLYITACFVFVSLAIAVNYKALYIPATAMIESPEEAVLWGFKVMCFFVGPALVLLALIGAGVPDIAQNFKSAEKRDEIPTMKVLAIVASVVATDLLAFLGLYVSVGAVLEHPKVILVGTALILIGIWQSIFSKEDSKK